MKRLIALSAFALALLAATPAALAQATPPPLPTLTPEQSADVERRMDAYRKQTEARVTRGEIDPDQADRLLRWREWQLAQQVTGLAPPPIGYDARPDFTYERPRDYVVVAPPPYYYAPYYPYAPYYWAPRPYGYYWGPSICAGGFGRHFGGRICF